MKASAADEPGLNLSWWIRRPFTIEGDISSDDLLQQKRRSTVNMSPVVVAPKIAPRITPSATVFTKVFRTKPKTIFVSLPHRSCKRCAWYRAEQCFLPSRIYRHRSRRSQDRALPDVEQPDSDDEEKSIALLYRYQRTFAIGHGCAADWGAVEDVEAPVPFVDSVIAESLPAYEVTSLTPDVYETLGDGSRVPVSVSMEELALRSTDAGRTQVEKVLALYRKWIAGRRASISDLPERYHTRGSAPHGTVC